MKKTFLIPILVIAAFFVFVPAVFAADNKLTPDQEVKMMNLSIPWVENQGQIDNQNVKFSANTLLGTVFITKNGSITYSLTSHAPSSNAAPSMSFPDLIGESRNNDVDPRVKPEDDKKEGTSVVIREVPLYKLTPIITGEELSPTKTNYFLGNDESKWQSNVSTYNLVSEGYIYPKIKLQLKAHNNNVEKIYTVLPYGNPKDIRMKVEGASKLEITKEGDLKVTPSGGDNSIEPIYFTAPIAYQTINNQKIIVTVKYKLLTSPPSEGGARGGEGGEEGLSYSFELGKYNPKYPLIIDPSLNYLVASTYLGGSGWDDAGNALTVDSSGNVYFCGTTGSTNFPISAGVVSSTYGGGAYDAFVVKINSDIATISASTYLGGSGAETGLGVVLDSSNNIYVTGYTASTNFPVTPGAASTTNHGSDEVFISELNNDLTSLIASTYLGGTGSDTGYSIALGVSGDIYITGSSASTNFPVTPGAASTTYGGGSRDAFIVKLSSDLTSVIDATYLGGSGYDSGSTIIFDSLDNVYTISLTDSRNLPVTPGAASTTYGGGTYDYMIARVSSDLSTISALTYLGGIGSESGGGLARDSSGNIYVSGSTASTNFPVTGGTASTTYGGGSSDAFISKLNSDLTTISASTYLGGIGADAAPRMKIDSSNNIYVVGYTASTNFPVTSGAASTTYSGGTYDGFVSKLNNSLTTISAATYFGGSGTDYGWALALGPSDNIYVTGFTSSANFPVSTGAYQRTYGGGYDAYAVKFGSYLPSVTSVSPNEVIQNADATTLTVTGTNFASGASVKFDGTALTTTFVSSTILTAILPASLVNTAGVRNVTVYNPLDDGGTSGNKELKINSVGVSRPPAATPVVTPVETPATPAITPVVTPTTPATTITIVPAVDPNTQGTYSPASAKEATPSLAVNLNIVPITNTVCTPDTLIKSNSSPSVYYCGEDGLRYVFANEAVYFTWFKDFADVKILTDAELAQIPLGHKLITHRPGVAMVKIQTDPKVYAVARGGVLRWIKDEAIAKLLYGDNWNTEILDVSDALFVNYTVGEPIQ